MLAEIKQLAGAEISAAITTVERPAGDPANAWATAIGFVTLGVGAFGVFMHLQDALNSIWRVESSPGETWAGQVKRRLCSFGTVVVTGFLLLVSLIVSAGLSWAGTHVGQLMGMAEVFLEALNVLLSFAMTVVLFAMVFKILPDTPIRWRDVVRGAIITAVLFTLGKAGLGFYFAKAKVASSYGVAGSVIALLIWSYYAAQIVYIGAEFTRVDTLTKGGLTPEAIMGEKSRTDSSRKGSGPSRVRKQHHPEVAH